MPGERRDELDEPTKIDADFDDVLEALLGVDEDGDEDEPDDG